MTTVVEKGIIKLPKDIPWPPGTVVRIVNANPRPI
jgi:hypothetical protein